MGRWLIVVLVWGAVSAEIEVSVGQVFMAPVYEEGREAFLERTKLGNVILFDWASPLESCEYVLHTTEVLTREIERQTGYRPLIAVDQEGGRVQRLGGGWLSAGALLTAEAAFEQGRGIGEQLRAAGVNLNLAPVVDLPGGEFLGDRAFFGNVTELARAFLAGMQPTLGCLKHFPGHGAAHGNSHYELPVIEGDLAPHLAPFREVGVSVVMVGHLLVPELDAERPATLSPAVIGLLRETFDGVILTDSLVMRGVAPDQGNYEEAVESVAGAAIEAFLAGCDLLLLSGPEFGDFDRSPELDQRFVEEVMARFQQSVDEGVISRERLAKSIARLQRLKP